MSQSYSYPSTFLTPVVGGATAANQVLEIAQLTAINANTASIDASTASIAADTASIDAKIVKADTDDVTVTSSVLPTGAATEATLDAMGDIVAARLSGSLVPFAFDYIALTYVAAGSGMGQVETATYKAGGSGGTTVATLTLTYDASNNVASVTKS